QFNLGVLYANGNGVVKDMSKAAELYQKAADHGNASAQSALAYLCYNGHGMMAPDASKAAELAQKAADKGIPDAQALLGYLYSKGKGVPKNVYKAADLLKKAADRGLAHAQYN